MKIVYLSNSQIPSLKANSIQVMKMCQAISQNGHDVKLFARTAKISTDDVYNYYGVNNNFAIEWHTWPIIKGLGGYIYAYKVYQNIIGNDLPDAFYGRDLYSILAISRLERPMIFEAHGMPTNVYHRNLVGNLLKKKNLIKLVVISESLKEAFKLQYPWFDKERVSVIRSGAECPSCYIENSGVTQSESQRIGYVGHLYPGKGMELIVPLAKILPDYEFHIIGGTDEDILHWKQISKSNNIIFHGFVLNKDLYKYYEQFDILIAPYQTVKSKGKSFGTVDKWASPMKIFEYMAYKKPIVASDLPMIREILVNRVNGMLCDPEDVNSWADTIKLLTFDSALSQRLSQKANADFKSLYTWQSRAKLAINLFHE